MSQCVFLWVYPVKDCLHFLNLIDYFLSHVGEVFNYNFFKNFLSIFLSSSSGIPTTRMLVHLILSQRSLRLSSILFILLPLFWSSARISTILSSSSLIRSSDSVIRLLFPSTVFLISVIVLFIPVCLFFISSMFLVIALTVLNIYCLFFMLFSSLQSIFTIIILNFLSGRLLISSLFIWYCVFLPCSFQLCCISLSFFFFLTCSTWGLLSPTFRVLFLLPFGFCLWRERLVEWFMLTFC